MRARFALHIRRNQKDLLTSSSLNTIFAINGRSSINSERLLQLKWPIRRSLNRHNGKNAKCIISILEFGPFIGIRDDLNGLHHWHVKVGYCIRKLAWATRMSTVRPIVEALLPARPSNVEGSIGGEFSRLYCGLLRIGGAGRRGLSRRPDRLIWRRLDRIQNLIWKRSKR